MFDIIDQNISRFFTAVRYRDIDVQTHSHGNLEILVVTAGTLTVELGGKALTVAAGQAVFIPPFVPHAFPFTAPHTLHALLFTKEFIPPFYHLLRKNTPSQFTFPVSGETLSLLDRFLPRERECDNYFYGMAVLGPLIGELLQHCRLKPSQSPLNDAFYEALAYMDEHAAEPLSRDTVAKAVGVHPSTLSECFSHHMQSNFNQVLNHIRCSNAALLMQKSDKSLTEIAFSTGFGSIRSFNRAFLKTYGSTPSEFRRAK